MADCGRMFDLISAHIDSELDEQSEYELRSHLASCPNCRALLDALTTVSDELSADLAEPPAELLPNVMAGVRESAGFPLAAKKSKTSARTKRIITRCAAAAACLALVVFAAPTLLHRGGSDSSTEAVMMAAAPSASFDAAELEPAAAPESSDISGDKEQSEQEVSDITKGFAVSNGDLFVPHALIDLPASDSDLTLKFSDPDANENEFVPDGLYYDGLYYDTDESLYTLVITVSGGVPKAFDDVSFTEHGADYMGLVSSARAEEFANDHGEASVTVTRNASGFVSDPALIIITH